MVLVDTGEHTQALRILSVRRLAGGLEIDDVADSISIEKLNNGDTCLEIMTGRTNWVEADPKWNAAILSSDYWAASELLDEIPGSKDEAESKRKSAHAIWEKINQKSEGQGSGGDLTVDKTAGDET